MKYEPLKSGSFDDYNSALLSKDYDSAWQILVSLALTSNARRAVETSCLQALTVPHAGLVRGALEAFTVLLRFRHPIDRARLIDGIRAIPAEIRMDRLVKAQLEDIRRSIGVKVDAASSEELDAIQARCERASQGPWVVVNSSDHPRGGSYMLIGPTGDDQPDVELSGATVDDIDFIVHAREDLPRLLDEIRRLRALCRE